MHIKLKSKKIFKVIINSRGSNKRNIIIMYTLTQPWTTVTYLSQKVTNILTKSQGTTVTAGWREWQCGHGGGIRAKSSSSMIGNQGQCLDWEIQRVKKYRSTCQKTLLKCLGNGIRNKKLQDSAIYKLDKPYFVYTFF